MAVVLAAPVAILPMVFSRYTVQLSFSSMGQVKSLLIDGLKVLFVISASCLVIGVLALPWMKDYLHLDTMVPILIVLAGMVLSHLMPALLGIFQGLLRFFSLGPFSGGFALGPCLGMGHQWCASCRNNRNRFGYWFKLQGVE
jgi:hypothetical protein